MTSIALTDVSASGFEVFEQKTVIPIRRLTLLYGPNSAGKSSVEEIFSLLQGLCTPVMRLRGATSFDVHPYSRGERLSRCWRRESDAPLKRVEYMTIGAEGRIFDNDPDSAEIGGISWLRFSHTVSIDFRFRLDPDKSEYSLALAEDAIDSPRADFIGPVRRDFMIRVNGDLLFAFEDGRAIGINRRHPIFSTGALSNYALNAVDEISGKGDAFREDSGILWLEDEGIELSPERRFRRVRGMVQAEHTTPGLNHAVRSMIDLGNSIVLPLFREFGEMFRSTMVPASRTIPSSENLAFLVERSKVGEDHPWFHIGAKGDARYRKLAMAFARQLSANRPLGRVARNYVERINSMLTSHLFGERGYFIDMDYRLVLTGDDLKRIEGKKRENIKLDDYAMLIRLFLADSEGRHYSFSEVGSGLGYVFPVICELCDQSSRMVQLQQPELHLHPAMQSGLGDVLLETVKLHGNLIVETHSEHLLLRILKRIRQRKSREAKALAADDIAVLYFEPREKGRTNVHQLRISEDGDFMDKWPRGFFMERDAELWDE